MVERKLSFNSDQLKIGIRRDHRNPRNKLGFINILNAMCHETGLKEFEPVESTVSSAELTSKSITLDWPFPLIYKGKSLTLLLDKTKIYQLNESTGVLTELTTYSMQSNDTVKVITAGEHWKVADFWDFVVLTNGTNSIFRSNKDVVLSGSSAKWLVDDTIPFNCCCDYRGRVIYGGFNVSNFWNANWEHFFEELASRHNKAFNSTINVKENFVWYSSPGGGNAMWLFMPDLYIDGFVGTDFDSGDFINQFLMRNDSGFIPVAFSGEIKFVKQLGNHLMIYGDSGMTAATHQSSPFSTLGHIPIILDGNILNDVFTGVSSVGGSNGKHLIIDKDGWLWMAVADASFIKLDKIGYYEKFNSMTVNEIVISHDIVNDRFYICDGESTYLFSNNGLTKVDQIITSVDVFDSIPKGCWVSTAGSTDNDFELETDIIDMKTRNLKTIYGISIGNLEDDGTSETFKFAISYKMDRGDTFTTTSYELINPDGRGHLVVQGVEFKIHLLSSKFDESPPPDYLYIYFEYSDNSNEERVKTVELKYD